MWSLVSAALKAFSAGMAAWNQERSIYNKPEMVKNKLDIAAAEARDAVRIAETTLSNPNSTPERHAEALRALRLAGS